MKISVVEATRSGWSRAEPSRGLGGECSSAGRGPWCSGRAEPKRHLQIKKEFYLEMVSAHEELFP